jgi:hypothetical protein
MDRQADMSSIQSIHFLLYFNNASEAEYAVYKTGISSTQRFKINSVYILTLINLISDIHE